MSEQPRDWDREMAGIDRVIANQGSEPAAGAPVPAPAGRVPPPRGPVPRRHVALTWFWVALALAMGLALLLWPYQRSCGLQLVFFLGAAGITALIALLGALASWSHHRALAHVLSLLVMLWAGFLVLREVLPRVGYARTSLTWMCEVTPVAPAARAPAPTAPAPGKPVP
jgi:hypothetical protein